MKTLKISERTHERLKKRGNKGETFSDIIDRLIKENKKCGSDECK